LPGRLKALSRELAKLEASSPAAALVAEDGSGFEALAAMVEQVEGVRFRELFRRLPTTRAETGREALQQVLALARGQSAKPSMDEFLQSLIAPLAAAAAAGQDIEPLLEELRQKLTEANPDVDSAQLDALIEAVRQAAMQQQQ
jgi:hypothetical protein